MKLDISVITTRGHGFYVIPIVARIPWDMKKLTRKNVRALLEQRKERMEKWLEYRRKTGKPEIDPSRNPYHNTTLLEYSLQLDLTKLDMIEEVYNFLK